MNLLRVAIALGFVELASAADIQFRWDPVDHNDVGLYELHYGPESEVYEQMVVSETNTATAPAPDPGDTSFFAVRACTADRSVCSGFSNEVSMTVPDGGGGDAGDSDGDGIADWADPDPLDENVGLAPALPANTNARVDDSWSYVDAASGFMDAVVIAGPPTYHDVDPGVVRLRNVSDLGFELRFQEWDLGDTEHVPEDIPFVVLLPGRHTMSDGSVWEVGKFDASGTINWKSVSFTQPFAKLPHLFLTVQTYNGMHTVSVRAKDLTVDGFKAALYEDEFHNDGHAVEVVGYLAIESPADGGLIDLDGIESPYLLQSLNADERWSPALSQRLKVEEERSVDKEVNHVDEALHVLALGDQFLAQQVTSSGSDTTALRRLEPTADAPMEWGLIRGVDHNWRPLPFAKTYNDPVLVVKAASNKDSDPGVIRLKDVTATDAQLRYQEWTYLDGNHAVADDIFYIVAEAGQHSLGGLTVEADSLVTNKLARQGQWEPISFNASFIAEPVVFASVMTYNDSDTVGTRIDQLDLSGVDLAMEEQEAALDGHNNETMGWIAIAQGSATTSEGRKLEVFFKQLNDNLTTVRYTSATGRRHPTVVADVDSAFEIDSVSLCYTKPYNAQIRLQLTEETSADSETNHVLEDVGVFVGD